MIIITRQFSKHQLLEMKCCVKEVFLILNYIFFKVKQLCLFLFKIQNCLLIQPKKLQKVALLTNVNFSIISKFY